MSNKSRNRKPQAVPVELTSYDITIHLASGNSKSERIKFSPQGIADFTQLCQAIFATERKVAHIQINTHFYGVASIEAIDIDKTPAVAQ